MPAIRDTIIMELLYLSTRMLEFEGLTVLCNLLEHIAELQRLGIEAIGEKDLAELHRWHYVAIPLEEYQRLQDMPTLATNMPKKLYEAIGHENLGKLSNNALVAIPQNEYLSLFFAKEKPLGFYREFLVEKLKEEKALREKAEITSTSLSAPLPHKD